MNPDVPLKFSIVIPTLNEEHYIGILLSALCNQDFKDFEVTVVDANSIDKTKEETLRYKDRLNLTFVESPKKGVSFQRNYGAKLSKYDHIIFFDADVEPEAKFLSKIAAYVKRKPADLLTSWNVPISDKLVDEFLYWLHNQIILEGIKRISPGAVGTFIYVKRSVFEKLNGFDEAIDFGEDCDLAMRVHKNGYKYVLLRDPKIRVSLRRWDLEGRTEMVWKTIKSAFMASRKGIKGIQGKFKHENGVF